MQVKRVETFVHNRKTSIVYVVTGKNFESQQDEAISITCLFFQSELQSIHYIVNASETCTDIRAQLKNLNCLCRNSKEL
jgi:hypothetical protein